MPACARVAKSDRSATAAAHVLIARIEQHFLNLLFGNPMLRTVLNIAIRIVIQVSNDALKGHEPSSLLYYSSTTARSNSN
jgi:hypothetical protein